MLGRGDGMPQRAIDLALGLIVPLPTTPRSAAEPGGHTGMPCPSYLSYVYVNGGAKPAAAAAAAAVGWVIAEDSYGRIGSPRDAQQQGI